MKFNQLTVTKDFLTAMAIMKDKYSFDQNAIALQFGMAVSIQPVRMAQVKKVIFTRNMPDCRPVNIPVYCGGEGYPPSDVVKLSMRLAFITFGWIEYRENITDCDFTETELQKIQEMVTATLASIPA